MTEISPKDMVYIEMATVAGHLGNIPDRKAGALLINHDGRIKGIGYFKTNVPEDDWYLGDYWYLDPIEILLLHTTPIDRDGGTIYTNGPVQLNQAQLLHEAGVRRVVLQDPRQDREGVPFMVAKEIQVDEVTGDLKQGENADENDTHSSKNKAVPE